MYEPEIKSCVYLAAPNSEEYLEAVKTTPYLTLEDLKEFTLRYGDVYFHPVSPTLIIVIFVSRIRFFSGGWRDNSQIDGW